MASALDILTAANVKRQQQASDVTGSLDRLSKTLSNFQQIRQQQRDNQIKQLVAQAQLQKAQTEAQNSQLQSQLLNTFLKGGDPTESKFPPGTTLKAGPLNIPLNRKLTESELSAVSGSRALTPISKDINKLLDEGVLDSKFGNFGRTLEQLSVDSQNALFTSLSPKLQEFQGRLNALKKTLPFTEGGKQLSPTEKEIVFALLKVTGKSNKQIKTDLKEALAIINEKEKLALGGVNAATKKEAVSDLPTGVSEDDIAFTMKKHGMTREQVLEALNA